MKTSSAKEKGSRLERKVASILRSQGFEAWRTPLSGGGSIKGDVYVKYHPQLYFECKNQEKVKLWEWWQTVREGDTGALVISGNHRPIVAVITMERYANLLAIEEEHRQCTKSTSTS